jgi:hypothetical protein
MFSFEAWASFFRSSNPGSGSCPESGSAIRKNAGSGSESLVWIVLKQDLNNTYNISEEISRYIIDNFTT